MKKASKSAKKSDDVLMNLNELAARLQNMLGDRHDTFSVTDGAVTCDLGGTFEPTCAEMQKLASRYFTGDTAFQEFEISSMLAFSQDQVFAYDNQALRCYYEYLKKGTNLQFLKLWAEGTGVFDISFVAQGKDHKRVVQNVTVDFGEKLSGIMLPRMTLSTLPVNASLYVTVSCRSKAGIINRFRWLGEVPAAQACMGERVVLIRTFGCRTHVVNSLTRIAQRLAERRPEILNRYVFVVYDASESEESIEIRFPESLRLLEIKGPNFGGGGNASLLVSALLRISEQAARYIEEVIIMDDDAKIDAETLIRHDAFVTSRKEKVISSAVVYQANNPSVIQEFGAFWGRYYDRRNRGVAITERNQPRLFMPYLIRNGKDMFMRNCCNDMAVYQEAEFATFIFISFPYRLLCEVGAPVPFFLRNDDVEISLRCLEKGATVLINPNIHAWHETAHNPVSEFYSVLHALIVNNTYGGLSREYVYATFMERTSRLASVGNCVLLSAYALALKYFALGPSWMQKGDTFSVYRECADTIKRIYQDVAEKMPYEVFKKMEKEIDLYNLVNHLPRAVVRNNTVFYDVKASSYYHFDETKTSAYTLQLLEQCITAIHEIQTNYDNVCLQWKSFLKEFSHTEFWDRVLKGQSLQLQSECVTPVVTLPEGTRQNKRVAIVNSKVETMKTDLPEDFSEKRYLEKNPDVAQSGIPPKLHWMKYGQYEGREY